jgi:hypothetical protein
MRKTKTRQVERIDAESLAISDIMRILHDLRDWNGGVRVLLYVLSRYWENGWRMAIQAHGSRLQP